jgi:hypothetical protein
MAGSRHERTGSGCVGMDEKGDTIRAKGNGPETNRQVCMLRDEECCPGIVYFQNLVRLQSRLFST